VLTAAHFKVVRTAVTAVADAVHVLMRHTCCADAAHALTLALADVVHVLMWCTCARAQAAAPDLRRGTSGNSADRCRAPAQVGGRFCWDKLGHTPPCNSSPRALRLLLHGLTWDRNASLHPKALASVCVGFNGWKLVRWALASRVCVAPLVVRNCSESAHE
jgi:hypothetical protein